MLIVTRRVGERLLIGQDVWVTVLRINGNQVRLGIDAPPGTTVQREEIAQHGNGNALPSTKPHADRDSP